MAFLSCYLTMEIYNKSIKNYAWAWGTLGNLKRQISGIDSADNIKKIAAQKISNSNRLNHETNCTTWAKKKIFYTILD